MVEHACNTSTQEVEVAWGGVKDILTTQEVPDPVYKQNKANKTEPQNTKP